MWKRRMNTVLIYVPQEEKEQERRRVKLQAEKLFQRWDLNHDGLVTWDEFLTCCLHDEKLEASFHLFDSVY